jgi:hypothetical protein
MLIGALLLAGCAGLQAAKQTTAIPYYETVYWGEQQECVRGDTTYIGRIFKTYQVYPKEDLYWVTEENSNGDDIKVTLVWDIPESPAMGACFEIDNVEGENCGIIVFDSLTGKQLLFDEFDSSGIINVMNYPPGVMRVSLAEQIELTKDYVIGNEYDYCELINRYFDTVE